jgi:hypothetical protein
MAECEMWGRAMTSNASFDIKIEGSPWKLFKLSGGSVLAAVVCAAAAIPLYPNFQPDIFAQVLMYFGAAFFMLCAVVWGWRLAQASGPVVTITPHGIRDIRLAADFIPWRAVRSIKTWEYSGQKCIVLSIDPAVERQLPLTAMARISRGPNRALGADGLCIVTHGLKIDYPELLSICRQRAGIPTGR